MEMPSKDPHMTIILKEGEYKIDYTPAEARQALWDALQRMAAEMLEEAREK